MPKVSDEHRAARRAEIIDAAIRVLVHKGYARTTMADIIAESGLSAGAIYGYFPGKQDIVYAVAEQTMTRRVGEITALSEDHVPHPAEVITTVLRGISRERFGAVIVGLWSESATDDHLRAAMQNVFARIQTTLVDALIAWGNENPDRIPAGADDWARRVALVLSSLGPGFMLFRTLLDGFDEESYLSAIVLALGLES